MDRIIDMFPSGQQHQVRMQLSQIIEAILSQILLPRIRGGRIAAVEVMVANGATRDLIREERMLELPRNMDVSSKEEGMQTIDKALANLVKAGVVSQEEALIRSRNPTKLRLMLSNFQVTVTK
jgi:twitching motility protein PilT